MLMCAPRKETLCFCVHVSSGCSGAGKGLSASAKCKDCHVIHIYIYVYIIHNGRWLIRFLFHARCCHLCHSFSYFSLAQKSFSVSLSHVVADDNL